MQLRVSTVLFILFMVMSLGLWSAPWGDVIKSSSTCVRYVLLYMGNASLLLAAVALISIQLYASMPRHFDQGADSEAAWLLQQFAWTERDLPARAAERNVMANASARSSQLVRSASVRRTEAGPSPQRLSWVSRICMYIASGKMPRLTRLERNSEAAIDAHERDAPPASTAALPMFCYETCVKLFFWAVLVYHYDEREGHTFAAMPATIREVLEDVDAAMQLFDLRHRQLFYDARHGTRILVGWNDAMVVVSARGTAERANFFQDAKV
jgi:hypothetical protein